MNNQLRSVAVLLVVSLFGCDGVSFDVDSVVLEAGEDVAMPADGGDDASSADMAPPPDTGPDMNEPIDMPADVPDVPVDMAEAVHEVRYATTFTELW